MYENASIESLKAAAQVSADASYAFPRWLETGRKVLSVAELADRQGDVENAYVSYLKLAGIIKVLIEHREYKQIRQSRSSDYLAFQVLQEKWHPLSLRIKQIEAQLTARQPSFPSVPTSPMSDTDNSQEPKTRSGSIADRIAALQSSSANASFRSYKPAAQEPEGKENVGPHTNGLGLNSLRGIKRPLPTAPPKPPKPTFTTTQSGHIQKVDVQQPLHVEDAEAARPGSAPIALQDHAPLLSSPQDAQTSVEAPTILQAHNQDYDTEITSFQSSFPTVEDIDDRYSLPSVPNGDLPTFPSVPLNPIAARVPRLGKPPEQFPVVASETGSSASSSKDPVSPTHSGTSYKGPDVSTLKRSSAIRGLSKTSSDPQKTGSDPRPPVSLPIANAVLPATLWSYLTADAPPSILLIDVRPQPDFDRLRIDTHVSHTICLEPIILRQELTSAQIEASWLEASSADRDLFANRHTYDLVVFYDSATKSLPANAASSSGKGFGDDASRCLWILNQAIYVTHFGRSLKRAPVLLVGGLNQWQKDVGTAGLAGSDLAQLQQSRRQSISETRAKLEARSASASHSPTEPVKRPLSGISEEKRQNRRAGMYDPADAPTIARTVGDVISGRPAADASYFTPIKQSPTLPFQSPSLTFPKQAARSNSGAYDQVKASATPVEYSSEPYTGYAPHTVRNQRPVDYPQIGPAAVHALQRPPLAAQPNGTSNRLLPAPPSQPQSRRISSTHTQTLSSLDTGVSLKSLGAISVPLEWYDGTVGVTGLKNLGNTCYMNSTIQCLSATIPFSKFFTEGSYRKYINHINVLGTKGALAETVAQLFRVLWEEQFTFVSPISFRNAIGRFAPQFQGTDQHDSQEFLAFLLDGLHEDLNLVLHKPPPIELTPEREAELEQLPTAVASQREWDNYLRRDNSFIVHWYQGQYRSRLQCQTCGQTSTTYNTFMYLSLPIPRHRNKMVSLEECVAAFCKEEILENTDAWNCPVCKVPRRATKRLTISRLPPILLIHFKRFSFHGPFSDKIDSAIDFPIYGLNLTAFLPPSTASDLYNTKSEGTRQPSAVYDLYGISQHFGTLSSGHYTAIIRSRHSWRHIGDSRMSDIDEAEVKKSGRNAYILFYRARL